MTDRPLPDEPERFYVGKRGARFFVVDMDEEFDEFGPYDEPTALAVERVANLVTSDPEPVLIRVGTDEPWTPPGLTEPDGSIISREQRACD